MMKTRNANLYADLESYKKDKTLLQYPKLNETIDHYIKQLKAQKRTRIKSSKDVYACCFESYKSDGWWVHWDIWKLKALTEMHEKETLNAGMLNMFVDSKKLERSKLEKAGESNEPIIVLLHEPIGDGEFPSYFLPDDSKYRVHARFLEGEANENKTERNSLPFSYFDFIYPIERYGIDGWLFPASIHMYALSTTKDLMIYQIMCNLAILNTHYSHFDEHETHIDESVLFTV